jgi:hypothetical protein
MRVESSVKRYVATSLLMAVVALGAVTAYGYHDTLQVYVNGRRLSPQEIQWFEQQYGVRAQSGRYWYDPRSGQLGLERGSSQGSGEQLYGRNWRNYGWTNPNGNSWGYSNDRTDTNVICDSGGCNFAR